MRAIWENCAPVGTPNHGQGYKEKNPKSSAPHFVSNEVSLMSEGEVIPVTGYLGHWGNLGRPSTKVLITPDLSIFIFLKIGALNMHSIKGSVTVLIKQF